MSDDQNDYLWDGSGPPDPWVAELEEALGPLGYDTEAAVPDTALPPKKTAGPRLAWLLLAAAALSVVVGGAWWAGTQDGQSPAVARSAAPAQSSTLAEPVREAPLRVTALRGTPVIAHRGERPEDLDTQTIQPQHHGELRVGGVLDTDGMTEARLEIGDLGQVTLGPRSNLRLVENAKNERRLALSVGRLHATINAPPRLFVVDTPSATAVDLGCEYALRVDEGDKRVQLDVFTGYVSLEGQKHNAYVPEGASCTTGADKEPGVPVYRDSSPLLAVAVEALVAGNEAELAQVLGSARQRDTLTLWHLLARVDAGGRGRLVRRMEALGARFEDQAKRAAIIRGDAAAIEGAGDILEPLWDTGPTLVPGQPQQPGPAPTLLPAPACTTNCAPAPTGQPITHW